MSLSDEITNAKFDYQPCAACTIDYGEDDDEKALSGLLTEDD